MAASAGTLLRSLPRPSLVPHSPFLHLRPLLEHMIVTSWLGSVHIFIRQYLNFLYYLYEEFDMFFSFKSLSVLSHLKQRSGSVFTTDSHNRIVALAELLPGLRRALCLGCSCPIRFLSQVSVSGHSVMAGHSSCCIYCNTKSDCFSDLWMLLVKSTFQGVEPRWLRWQGFAEKPSAWYFANHSSFVDNWEIVWSSAKNNQHFRPGTLLI